MKILIIRNYPSYMSVKKNTYNIQEVGLAKALIRKGHICDIVFWTDKNEETITIPVEGSENVINIFYKKGRTALKNTIFKDCDDLYKKYDVLQPCEYNQMQSLLLAKKYPEKTVIFHGPYYSPFNKRYNLMCNVFDKIFLKNYILKDTKFLAKSVMAKDFLVNKGISSENIYTCGVGIDTQVLKSNDENCNQPIYIDMNKNKNNLNLLYVGRIEERRNLHFIFDLLKKVLEYNKDAKLYIIGTGEKKYVESVWEYAKNIGVYEHIFWHEKVEQKYLSKIYELATFFLLPTLYEIFGMVLLEAMYFKTVVLTTYNGGSSTLIENEVNGFVFNDLDVDKWVNVINEVYKDKEKFDSIRNSAHDKIDKYFLWDSLVPNFEKAYLKK